MGPYGSETSEDLIREARESLSSSGEPQQTETRSAVTTPIADIADELPPDPFSTIGVSDDIDTARRPQPPPAPQSQSPDPTPPPAGDPRRGLVLAIGAAGVGALAWALLLAYAEIQSWLLGIGIGWLVGTAALRGAGTLDTRLKVVVGLLPIAAVLLGEVLGVALLWNKEYGFFDLPLAAEFYFDHLGQFGGDSLFALGGGALGAWTAVTMENRVRKS